MDINSENRPETKTDRVLTAMWRNWALSIGALVLPMFLALFVVKTWLPLLVIAEVYVLAVLRRSNTITALSYCSVLLGITIRALVLSVIVMLCINILCTDWLIPESIHLQLYNREIPFVTCLVVFPCAILFGSLSLYSGLNGRECRECQQRNGYYAGDSIVGTLFYREARYQTILLILISFFMGGIEYWYYFARYINTDMNDPDRFFFIYMPLIIYLASLVFMWGRYESARHLYHTLEKSMPGHPDSTTLRFLIFSSDELLLHADEDGNWDTPAEKIFGGNHEFDEKRARSILSELTDLNNFSLRYCYTSEGFYIDSRIVHYAAFIEADERERLESKGMWFNAYMLDQGLATNTIKTTLTNELYRIHTITMAWKTYDRNGRRLYPIKHYRPTFRLRDLRDWQVDYDDESWFNVAHNNEDRHFFRLRQLWMRITDIFNRKHSVSQ